MTTATATPPIREIFTVTQLNQTVRTIIEGSFPLLWVEGEISNLSKPSSGHLYFSLKDAQCQLRCAMFRTRNAYMNFIPQNGIQVLARGHVSLYEARGDFQLIVEHLEPAGDGLLRQKLELLKRQLAAEGLFDESHKQLLPDIPQTIGVITSPTGAAIRDIVSVLRRRFPIAEIVVYPVPVQGKEAAPAIVKALKVANQRQECEVLILARGGGSLEDLWPFNEESLVRAMYACKIPIVTGIGHEIDFTLADLVADQRAATPTAAAELVSPDYVQLLGQLRHFQLRLQDLMSMHLRHAKTTFTNLSRRLVHPARYLQELTQRLDDLNIRLNLNLQHRLALDRQRLAELSRALHVISPLHTLARGYAIVTAVPDRRVVRDAGQVNPGDRIVARLARGTLHCLIETVHSENETNT